MKLAQWENAVAVASNHEQLGQFEAAVALYGKAAAIDDGFAELHFRLAGCYVHLGRFDEARKHFALARDLDTLRFRADSRINELIRGTASARVGEGVVLVDTARAFEDERVSPHGIPGRTLFLEHVHMTFAGNYALARSLFEGVQGLLPDSIRGTSGGVPTAPDSSACAAALAYTAFDEHVTLSRIREMATHPPFTAQLGHELRARRLHEQLRGLTSRLGPDLFRSAVAVYRRALRAAPDDLPLRVNLAHLLAEHRAWAEAAALWEEVLERVPVHADAHLEYGAVLLAMGRRADAERHFGEALRLAHAPAEYHNTIGEILAAKDLPAEALEHFRRGLELHPGHAGLHVNLGAMLQRQGDRAGALAEFARAVALHPADAVARGQLGVALILDGHPHEAEQHLSEAVRLDPCNATARDHLAVALARHGKYGAAARQLAEAVKLAPENDALKQRYQEVLMRMAHPEEHAEGHGE